MALLHAYDILSVVHLVRVFNMPVIQTERTVQRKAAYRQYISIIVKLCAQYVTYYYTPEYAVLC